MTAKICVTPGVPIILVDGSYYIFHRYFATLRWWSLQKGLNKEEQERAAATLHEDTGFVAAFFKHVCQDILKWRKKWGVRQDNIVFGFDCPRGDIWRNKHHNDYKGTRTASASFNGGIFPLFYEWFGEHAEALGLARVEHERLEADDVLFLTAQHIETATEGNAHVVVITNDNDYLQMRGPHVTLVNASMQDLAARSSIGTPEQDVLCKILMGDASDNIPAVAPKMGPTTAKKLALQGREAVVGWAQERGCLARFLENERLISFAHIPTELVAAFDRTYEIAVAKN
jgi:5'-3' exonuclease